MPTTKRLRFNGSSAQQLPLGQTVLLNVWLEFSKKQFKIVMQKQICTVSEMEVIIMEIVLFVNERPLGETNINDEDIPITPNMLATGRPMRQLRTPSTAIMERIDPHKMWLERKKNPQSFLG